MEGYRREGWKTRQGMFDLLAISQPCIATVVRDSISSRLQLLTDDRHASSLQRSKVGKCDLWLPQTAKRFNQKRCGLVRTGNTKYGRYPFIARSWIRGMNFETEKCLFARCWSWKGCCPPITGLRQRMMSWGSRGYER